jgi:hypothetical protein
VTKAVTTSKEGRKTLKQWPPKLGKPDIWRRVRLCAGSGLSAQATALLSREAMRNW